MSETFKQKVERNVRVRKRYDDLMHDGKHGHYETMFRVIREEVDRECERCALIVENPGFIQARDTEWDAGVNFAKMFIATAVRHGVSPGAMSEAAVVRLMMDDDLAKRGLKDASWYCDQCQVEVYQHRCLHCGKTKRERT